MHSRSRAYPALPEATGPCLPLAIGPVPFGSSTCLPEPATQRAIVEPLFNKRLSEGDFWFTVVSEWLNQWKRHVGISSTRKHYHTRAAPGPILTVKDHGYSAELVPSDAWKVLLNWYGLAEGHKVIKHAVYKYSTKADIELHFNSFFVFLYDGHSNPDEESDRNLALETPNIRCSKLEKVGHVEWKSRQMYHIPENRSTRLWGKTIDSDSHWKPLFLRDKPIGKLLEIDSDFLRSAIALEICDPDGQWNNQPKPCIPDLSVEVPIGKMSALSIFDDPASKWESEVHDQIDDFGKDFINNLHKTFSHYVCRARDFAEERDLELKEREQQISLREERLRTRESIMNEREMELNSRIEDHEYIVKQFEEACTETNKAMELERKQHEMEAEQVRFDLQETREAIEAEKKMFENELQKMGQLHQIQESRIKLDIGGQLFTTSKLTLTKEPDSMLAAMFSGRHALHPEPDGSYFIDRDGTHFRYILNYLRDGGIKEGTLPQNEVLLRELITEAQYYQLDGLVCFMRDAIRMAGTSARPSEEGF